VNTEPIRWILKEKQAAAKSRTGPAACAFRRMPQFYQEIKDLTCKIWFATTVSL
jgi:hypothetical protein